MVKHKQVKFWCNNCKKETDYKEDGEGTPLDKDGRFLIVPNPYPYEEGWIYSKSTNVKTKGIILTMEDVHFCSLKCYFKYIEKQINDITKKQMLKELKRREK